ncbi:MAG: hypothetical protein ACLUIX_00525 [Oscillospiraceae bacterium]
MYNRYIRNEQGAYSRIPNRNRLRGRFRATAPSPPSEPRPAAGRQLVTGQSSGRLPPKPPEPSPRPPEGRFLDRSLSRLHLGTSTPGICCFC